MHHETSNRLNRPSNTLWLVGYGLGVVLSNFYGPTSAKLLTVTGYVTKKCLQNLTESNCIQRKFMALAIWQVPALKFCPLWSSANCCNRVPECFCDELILFRRTCLQIPPSQSNAILNKSGYHSCKLYTVSHFYKDEEKRDFSECLLSHNWLPCFFL